MWLVTMSTADRDFVAFTDLVDRDKAMTACKRRIRALAGTRLTFTHVRCIRFDAGTVAVDLSTGNADWGV